MVARAKGSRMGREVLRKVDVAGIASAWGGQWCGLSRVLLWDMVRS